LRYDGSKRRTLSGWEAKFCFVENLSYIVSYLIEIDTPWTGSIMGTNWYPVPDSEK
jgi:hypothetical protein